MSENPDYGGTKINKKPKVNFQDQASKQQQMQMVQQQQRLPPQPQRPPSPQQGPPQPPPQQFQVPPPPPPPPPPQQGPPQQLPPQSVRSNKSKFGSLPSNIQNSLLVLILFIVLNSKIIWRQIMKLPFMGTVEPSMIALIVNSLIAAVVYFIITKYILN